MEIKTVASSPKASVTSMRLKPDSGAPAIPRPLEFSNPIRFMASLRMRLGGDDGEAAAHLARRVDVQGPLVGAGSVHRSLQNDGRGSRADRAVGGEGDGRGARGGKRHAGG